MTTGKDKDAKRERSILKASDDSEISQSTLHESCSTESDSAPETPAHSELDEDELSLHVKFDKIEIRNYGMILGDNPGVSYGPPVTLDWDYDVSHKLPLDEYEQSRGARRKSYQMQMNAIHRTRILEKQFTEDEMKHVVSEMKKIKKGRERTKMMLPFWKIEDAAESAKRKTKRAVG